METLIPVLVVLVIIGLIVWAINSFLPIDARFKQLIVVVAIIAALLYILKAFGIWSGTFG